MRIFFTRLLPFLLIILGASRVAAQSCISTGLNGTAINLPCNVSCAPFKFQVPHLKSTSDYSVVTIPYAPYPFSNAAGNELTEIYIDDKFSNLVTMPFNFCFYDSIYAKCVIGSNGIITFDETTVGLNNAYTLTTGGAPQPIPYNGGTAPSGIGTTYYPPASIMGAYHDIYPNASNVPANRKIEWTVVGTAPCRKFVLSYFNVPMFSCTNLICTEQIVLHESTGIIDVHLLDKPLCTSFNQGLAILGIQNWQRNKAVAAPGKNATQWTAQNESYRFIPSGPVSRFTKAELLDIGGNVLATTGVTPNADTATTVAGLLDLNFPQQCPAGASTQYIVKTYFSACVGGTQLVSSDTITVNKTTSLNATTGAITPSACGPNGSVTVNIPAGAGTPPYSLTIDGGAPVSTSNQNYTFTGLLGGAHSIVITSAGGCSQTLAVTVPTSGVLSINSASTATSCNGAANGSITLTPQNGVAPFQYSINGGAFISFPGPSHTISNLASGNYFLTIKDASGCQLNNMLATVGQGGPLSLNIIPTAPACAGASNGFLTVNPTTGTAPYTYSINGGAFQASNVFGNLATGTYFISVQDAIGCYVNNAFATVGASTGTLNATAAGTGTSCSGINNGSINITPTNGSSPYQYSINGGTTFLPGTSITGLAPGSYSVIVKDNAGCTSAPIPVTVAAGNALLATAASVPTSCTGVNNGSITVTPTNGASPYSYQLDGGSAQTSNVFTNVSAGNHNIIVTDASGCVSNAIPVTVAVGPAITGTTATTATSCNGAVNGSITVTPTNGSGPYTYQMDGGTFQGSNTFTGVAAGSHTIIIRDGVGCTSTTINVTVAAGPALTGTATSTATSCTGVSNGSITATPTNGNTPFQYSLDGAAFQVSNIFSGVGNGSHTVVIRDAAGCLTAAIPVTVAIGPAITGTSAATATSCSGAADGTVTITPGTGSAPYQYSVDNGPFQANNVFSNLTAGAHTFTIRDAAGCTSTNLAFVIAAGSALTATAATTPTSCSGAVNGTITLTTTNGTGPFEYSIDGTTFQSSNTFSGLATGIYTITWRNNSGCQSTTQVTVNPGSPLSANVAVNNVLCNAGTTGSAAVTISTNGAPPYQYSLDGTTWQASNNFTGLAAGSYTVYFRDQNNCAGTQAFAVTQPTPLVIAPAEQAALCNGQTNGTILIGATGGAAPYQYSINGTTWQASNSFNVAAGNYTVYVRDNNSCVKTQLVTVAEPSILTGSINTANATCDGGNNGTITVSANGGTAPYQYSSNGTTFQSSNVLNVNAGSYTVTIKDANGCTITRNAIVGLTNNLTVTPVADTTICEGISVQLQPNTNATQFVWSPAFGLNAVNIKQPIASPATTTEYIVTATLGVCSANDTMVVNVLPAPVPNAGADGDICYGQTFRLQGSGGISYDWSPGTYLNTSIAYDPMVTPTQTIQYSLSVTDANGCRSLQPDVVTVNVTPPIVVKISKDTVVASGDVFQLFASSVATDYVWSPAFGLDDPGKPTPMVTVTGDITYTVTATTSAGCKGEGSVTLKVYDGPEIYVPTAFTPNGDGKNDVFRAFPVGIKRYTYMRVFNRWGQMIFSTTDFNRGWDGTINGKPQPTGTYIWMVEGITKEDKMITKKGTVTIIR